MNGFILWELNPEKHPLNTLMIAIYLRLIEIRRRTAPGYRE